MTNAEKGHEVTKLRPAELEQGAMRKLRKAVFRYWLVELWALLWGSHLLWFLGVLRLGGLHEGLAVGVLPMTITLGDAIETWLGMMSGEPLLNEREELESMAPFMRGSWYILPPFVAVFGFFGGLVWWSPLVTSGVSLLLFGRIILRIRRTVNAWESAAQ